MGLCCIRLEINKAERRTGFRAYIGRETSICIDAGGLKLEGRNDRLSRDHSTQGTKPRGNSNRNKGVTTVFFFRPFACLGYKTLQVHSMLYRVTIGSDA